jgi:glycosyltransferase involved in cell wall biosynthesis
VDAFPAYRGGQRQVALLARGQRALGHIVHAAVRNEELDAELREAGVDVFPWEGTATWVGWWELRGLLRRGWDRVHVHDAAAQAAVRILGPEAVQAALVVHRRIDDVARNRAWTRWKYARGQVIAVSEAAARSVADLVPPDRVHVVRSGLPIPSIATGPRPSPDEPFQLVAVGALVEHKGHDLLIRAVGRLPDESKLLIIGEGPRRQRLERLTAAMGLRTRVFFAGHIPNPRPLLGRADLLVHPSRTEGLGSGVIDGMACGLPVLATDVGGLPELVIPGETGWLVRPDVDALTDAILAAQRVWREDHEAFRRLGTRGHARASERLQADRMVRGTEDVVRRTLGDATHSAPLPPPAEAPGLNVE